MKLALRAYIYFGKEPVITYDFPTTVGMNAFLTVMCSADSKQKFGLQVSKVTLDGNGTYHVSFATDSSTDEDMAEVLSYVTTLADALHPIFDDIVDQIAFHKKYDGKFPELNYPGLNLLLVRHHPTVLFTAPLLCQLTYDMEIFNDGIEAIETTNKLIEAIKTNSRKTYETKMNTEDFIMPPTYIAVVGHFRQSEELTRNTDHSLVEIIKEGKGIKQFVTSVFYNGWDMKIRQAIDDALVAHRKYLDDKANNIFSDEAKSILA